MKKHACPRCGYESSRDRWWDRHPALTVLFALPAGYTVIGVLLAYPWFFVPTLIVICALLVNRAQRRRAAITARADHEYRQLIAGAVFAQPRLRRRAADHSSITQPIRRSA